ncbi:hypothetical protein GCM10009719_38370 [Nocardioides kribbensis]
MGGRPEEADRAAEAPGELESGRGLLAQRDEEGVLEGHAAMVTYLCNELQEGGFVTLRRTPDVFLGRDRRPGADPS